LTQPESDIGPTPVSGHGNDRDHRPKQQPELRRRWQRDKLRSRLNGGRVVPITLSLNGVKFDRETTRVMSVAFEMTRIALGLADRFDQANELVAKRIIDLAKQGECNPDVLCERALKSLREQYL
jgi:hypothetical protein